MKKYLSILLLILALSGCAFLQVKKDDMKWCYDGKHYGEANHAEVTLDQQACYDKAVTWQERAETGVDLVASVSPLPWVEATKKPIGYGALAVALLILGGARPKKKPEPNVNVTG